MNRSHLQAVAPLIVCWSHCYLESRNESVQKIGGVILFCIARPIELLVFGLCAAGDGFFALINRSQK